MFSSNNRFTQRAQNALKLAHEAAGEMGHSYVGSEHLLVGLVRESEGIAAKALRTVGVSEKNLSEAIVTAVGKGDGGAPAQGLTPRTKHIVELAMAEAARLGHGYVGTEHLLMGMLREYDSVATRLLVSAGVDIPKLYRDVSQMIGDGESDTSEGQGSAMGGAPQKKKSQTKTLDQFGRDLTEIAGEGKLDPIIGRDEEISRIIQILSRRTKNNPVLIGEPGVGKTAVAEGLAQKIVAGDIPENLRGKRLFSLDISGMIAGTKYRGEFEERIKSAMEEIRQAGNVIVFIDELHTIIGAGAAEGAVDAANILKPALSRGEIQVIGATTLDEYRKHIEKDAALERRFQPVMVGEPTESEALEILKGLRDRYEAHHKLKITDEAMAAAVEMSNRYISDRQLPDKAIDLIDEAASRVRMQNLTPPPDLKALEEKADALAHEKEEAVQGQEFEKAARLRDEEKGLREKIAAAREAWQKDQAKTAGEVTVEDVAAVVASSTGIPVTRLTEDEAARLLHMEDILHRRVVGQDEAVSAVSKAIRRGRVGLKDPKRPTGSFIFLGPTGVGKTELCRALAEAIFGDEEAIIRVDMSEFMEKHTTSKLIGSPPGYVGYDEGGQLTEKVRRRPYSVVLFDEIEKAHPDVFNLLLQILEDGILTDAQGRRVNFKNTVVVMTSNLGAHTLFERKRLGFAADNDEQSGGMSDQKEIRETVLKELKKAFRPEFLNRIDDIIVFHQLDKACIKEISLRMMETVLQRVEGLGVTLHIDDSAIEAIAEAGFDPVYGARPLRRAIQSKIEDAVAEKLLDTTVTSREFQVVAKDGVIQLTEVS
ncbi:ATP-dependent Clp protease ATP-binding subunit [Oscillospiraceae bacterium OttesenSCG-928-F05]|nr:ATP-dependent Clp protease ATP-binding subunit [Oscillospiraceae bacterium OttesenSCG-928-F05]